MTIKNCFLLILCLFCLFGWVWPVAAGPVREAQEKPAFSEKLTFLSRQPADTSLYVASVAVNPQLTHVAYIVAKEKSMQVMVNQNLGPAYDHIAKGYPVFSATNHRLGYIATRDETFRVVIDEKEYPGYEGACCLRFSPDGQHHAYIAEKKSGQVVVVDGKPHQTYAAIDRKIGVRFSPRGGQVAYVARQENGAVVLVQDGRASRAYDDVRKPTFSPDGRHLASLVSRDKQYFVRRDNREIGPYDMVDSPTWSPDSRHLAFIAIKQDKWLIVKDEQEIVAGDYNVLIRRTTVKPPWYFEGMPERHRLAYKRPQTLPPTFGPKSSRLAWSLNSAGKYRLCVDGKKGPLFDQISEPVFSPDGKNYAYVGAVRNDYLNKEVMVVNGEPGLTFDFIGVPVFSPDGKHLAFRAKDGKDWFVVRDGQRQKSYDAVLKPYFSADATHLAYLAARGRLNFMVTNGRPSPPYQKISRPFFGPAGHNLCYLAGTPGEKFFLVANYQKGQLRFDSHLGILPEEQLHIPDKNLVFITPDKARTIVFQLQDDRYETYRLDIDLNPQK